MVVGGKMVLGCILQYDRRAWTGFATLQGLVKGTFKQGNENLQQM
jgi:hypothetical protein